MKPMQSILVPVLCCLMAPSLPAAAASALPLAKAGVAADESITLAQWGGGRRGHHGWRGHHGHHGHRGPGPAGIFGAIIAGALIAAAIREGRAQEDDIARCEGRTSTRSITARAPTSTATAKSACALICADVISTKRVQGAGCGTGAFRILRHPRRIVAAGAIAAFSSHRVVECRPTRNGRRPNDDHFEAARRTGGLATGD